MEVQAGCVEEKSASNDVEDQVVPELHKYTNKSIDKYPIVAGLCLSVILLSFIVVLTMSPSTFTLTTYFLATYTIFIMSSLEFFLNKLSSSGYASRVFDPSIVWKFLPAAILFVLSLFTNTKLLLHNNNYTLIVFFSAILISVAIGETLFLHQPCPSLKTWALLATIFGGSLVYATSHYHFTIITCTWALAYIVTMSIGYVYINHVVTTIGLNKAGVVLHRSLEASLLFLLQMIIMGKCSEVGHQFFKDPEMDYVREICLCFSSGGVYVAFNFFGVRWRRSISATGFAVLGIVTNHFFTDTTPTVSNNLWTIVGTVGLFICLLSGELYTIYRKQH